MGYRKVDSIATITVVVYMDQGMEITVKGDDKGNAYRIASTVMKNISASQGDNLISESEGRVQ